MLYILFIFIGVAFARAPVLRLQQETELFRRYIDDTRAEHDTTLEERMATSPNAKAWENSGRYEGDVLLGQKEAEQLIQSYSSRNAYIWPESKWPQNTIVYEFTDGEFDEAQQSAIIAAIEEIEQNTCIRFRERRPGEEVYVRLTGYPDGCYANIGYWAERGPHIYNLAKQEPGRGCFRHTTIVHEWMHIIGFMHMQSTYNRDDYVKVQWENIQRGTEFNFDGYTSEIVDNLGVPYEYASNMHYGPYAFSSNGEPTLVGYHDYENKMGQQEYVTPWDWLRVNRHYNCPGA